jgi:arabinogalactan oligomer/maltooligosaccharide transport system permease protein
MEKETSRRPEPSGLASVFVRLGKQLAFLVNSFRKGDGRTRLSYVLMGFSNLTRGQVAKGIYYLLCEVAFATYMVTSGARSLAGLHTLGTKTQHIEAIPGQVPKLIPGDNSMLMLLYGVAAVLLTVWFIATYFWNVSSAVRAQELQQQGKPLPSLRVEVREYLDAKFHITLLFLPVVGVLLFTVLPLVFMILIAFTNYDSSHQPPGSLFHWTGLYSFKGLFSNSGVLGGTFWPVLGWTLTWAIVATASNYILGMLLAILINRKGIKFKGLFRTVFVLSIAIPQFVSLLIMRNMLDDFGPINGILQQWGLTSKFIPFLTNATFARLSVLVVNLWVGVPYTMLITSGILISIPRELYEAAMIDGASPFQLYTKIILPFVLFVTAPYLITQFIGNINNFNVIYLLTGGGPNSLNYYQAGKTDLLVTWLYKLTVNTRDYSYASAIGICVFIISAVLSLIAYRNTKSYKNEETFQ